MIVEAIIDAGPGMVWPESRPQVRCPSSQVSTVLWHLSLGSLAGIQVRGMESVESTIDSGLAPDPGEFGPVTIETIETTIDAGPGVFWPESRPQARCPSSRISTVLRHLVLGSLGQNQGHRHGAVESTIDSTPGESWLIRPPAQSPSNFKRLRWPSYLVVARALCPRIRAVLPCKPATANYTTTHSLI